MAIVKGFLQMTGSIKGVSFYTRVGSDKVIMRTKGGPKKYTMKHGENFAKVRLYQNEWSGCIQFSQSVRCALGNNKHLADFNLSPVLNGMGVQILKLDTVNEIGKRKLCLSVCKQELEGYNLNKSYPITSILGVSPFAELNRETLSATVSIPRINTETDLQNIQRLPYFRLIVNLGLVSDMMYTPDGLVSNYKPVNDELNVISQSTVSEWYSTNNVIPSQVMSVQIDEKILPLLTDDITVLLSMGIEFGNVGFGNVINPVQHAGCGKILKSC
jgi:hypothetical protein